jgi:hypothetical protein
VVYASARRSDYSRRSFAKISFRLVRLMVLSIPATVTVGFGTTYHFRILYPPSGVTILLAQFADLKPLFKKS